MTVRGPLVTRAPARVDLQAARAEASHRLRWQRVTALLPMAPLMVMAILNLLLLDDEWSLLAWLPAPALGVAMAVAAAIAFDHRCDRRAGGPASKGRSSFGEVVSTAPGPVLWRAVQDVLGAAGFAPVTLLDAHTVQATRWHRGGRYWIIVRIEGLGADRGRVTAWAHPDTGWFGGGLDLGRNRRHANAVLRAVPDAHDPAREPDISSRA